MIFPLRSAFLALPLTGVAKRRFREMQESLGDVEDILRMQPAATPHLTLTFWREMMEIEYGQVLAQCQRIADRSMPFILRVNGVDVFSDHGEDRVLFLTVEFSPDLAELKKRCPWPNEPGRPFSPHIALARIRHPQRFVRAKKKVLTILKNVAFPMTVDRLRLYANVEGKSQTAIGEFMFGTRSPSH
jgi:2'-5' RNA ligase